MRDGRHLSQVYQLCNTRWIYSGPPLIRIPFLPNNSLLIREVDFGEGVLHVFIVLAAKNLCPFERGVLCREGPLFTDVGQGRKPQVVIIVALKQFSGTKPFKLETMYSVSKREGS